MSDCESDAHSFFFQPRNHLMHILIFVVNVKHRLTTGMQVNPSKHCVANLLENLSGIWIGYLKT
jgi:hypothetical protein